MYTKETRRVFTKYTQSEIDALKDDFSEESIKLGDLKDYLVLYA